MGHSWPSPFWPTGLGGLLTREMRRKSVFLISTLRGFYFLDTKVPLNILWLQFPEEFLPCLFPCLARWLVTRSLCVQALCLLWVQGVTDCYSLCGGFCFQCAFWYMHWTLGWSLGKKVKRSIFNHIFNFSIEKWLLLSLWFTRSAV